MEDSEPCFFLEKIPGEMRNRIYDYALLGEGGEMTLRSSDTIALLRRGAGGEQEIEAMSELQALEKYVDATEPALREQRSIILQKKRRAKALEGDLQRLHRTVRATVDKTRELEKLREKIPDLENEPGQMSANVQEAKRGARVIRTDYLLGSRDTEPPVFRDMQNLFALSRTCKQIRAECFKLVYDFNKVKFIVGPEAHCMKRTPKEMLHKHLQYILQRQLKLGELKMGLIIDFGLIPRTTNEAIFGLTSTIREYQSRLRKLRKATPSMEIQFRTDEKSQQQGGLEKGIFWKLMLDTPESVVAQFDAHLAAEEQWLHQPNVEHAKEVLVKVFWPLWAVQNLL